MLTKEYHRTCVVCGKEFVTCYFRQKTCCPDCSHALHNSHVVENNRKRAERKALEEKPKPQKQYYQKRPVSKKKPKTLKQYHKDDKKLVKACKEAKQLGLSYGEYMALQQKEMART